MSDRSHRSSGTPFDALSDDELLAAVRAGDTGAYSVLYHRHLGAALRQARRLGGPDDPQDVAQEAFLKILKTIMRGGGPRDGFIAYLLRAVRNEIVDRSRRAREVAVEDIEQMDPEHSSSSDGVDERFDQDLVKRAFDTLPEKWQQVLWLTEVEGLPPRAVAPQLQQSPNTVAQLARRAREGLRTAWLQAHVDLVSAQDACRHTAGMLGGYERGQLSATRTVQVETHLDGCVRCAVALAELREVSTRLRGVLLPIVLGCPLLLGSLSETLALPVAGGALMAGMGGAGSGAAPGAAGAGSGAASAVSGVAGAGGSLARLASYAATHGWTLAVAGVTTAGLAGGIVLGVQPQDVTERAPQSATSSSAQKRHPGAANLAAARPSPAPTALPEPSEEDLAADGDPTAPVALGIVGHSPVKPEVVLNEPRSGASAEPDDLEVELRDPVEQAPATAPHTSRPAPTEPSLPSGPAQDAEQQPSPGPTDPSVDPTPLEPADPAEPADPPVDMTPLEPVEPTDPPVDMTPLQPVEPETSEPDPDPTEPEPDPSEPEPPVDLIPLEPTEPPVDTEDPALEAPTLEAPAGGDRLYPVTLGGEGSPGAVVRILDDDGTETATATVGEDGRWSASPQPGAPDAAIRYHAVQEKDGETSEAGAPSEQYVFRAPTLRSPTPGSEVSGDLSAAGLVVLTLEVSVPERAGYSMVVGGRSQRTYVPSFGTTAYYPMVLREGEQTVELAYRDPDTGQLGAVRTATFALTAAD